MHVSTYLEGAAERVEQDSEIQQDAFAIQCLRSGIKVIIATSERKSYDKVCCDSDDEICHISSKALKSSGHAKLDLQWDRECVW